MNATRTLGTGNVTFVYNITKNGTEVRSEEAVRTLGLLSDQEMALTLGYVVAEKASSEFSSLQDHRSLKKFENASRYRNVLT